MTTCHLADVPKPRPELVALVTTKVINDVAALVAEARIDRSYQCPFVAGVSEDSRTVYVGSDVPEMLSDGENEFHSDAGVAWHEIGEKYFMDALGLDYDDAHSLVTWLVEQPVVTQIMRLNFDGYQRAFDPYVVGDEHEKLINVAPDLFLGPYEDDEPELLASIRRAQGIEGRLNRLEDRRDPYGVGKIVPLGSDIRAAGVAYVAPDGEVLFLRRGRDQDHPGEWCLPGGCVEGHEGFAQAAAREFQEETSGRVDPEELREVAHVNQEGVDFVTFLARGEKFDPVVSDESSDTAWRGLTSPPTPLHPGVAGVMVQIAAVAYGSLDKAATEARDDRGRWVASGGVVETDHSKPLSSSGNVQEAAENFSNQIKSHFPNADVRVSHSGTPAGNSSYVTVYAKESVDAFAGRKTAWDAQSSGSGRGPSPTRQTINAEYRISDHDTGIRQSGDYVGHLKPNATYGDAELQIDKIRGGILGKSDTVSIATNAAVAYGSLDKAAADDEARDDHGRWTSGGTFYHSTTKSKLKSIKEKGLTFSGNKRNFSMKEGVYKGDRAKSVFVASNFEKARLWAENMIDTENDKPIIIKVEIPPGQIVVHDEIDQGDHYRFKGNIPPEWITGYSTFNRVGVKPYINSENRGDEGKLVWSDFKSLSSFKEPTLSPMQALQARMQSKEWMPGAHNDPSFKKVNKDETETFYIVVSDVSFATVSKSDTVSTATNLVSYDQIAAAAGGSLDKAAADDEARDDRGRWTSGAGGGLRKVRDEETNQLNADEQKFASERLASLSTSKNSEYAQAYDKDSVSVEDLGMKDDHWEINGTPPAATDNYEKYGRLSAVPLNGIGTSQDAVSQEGLKAYIARMPDPKKDGYPEIAMAADGSFHLLSGHTRAGVVALGGRSHVIGLLFQFDSNNQWIKEKPSLKLYGKVAKADTVSTATNLVSYDQTSTSNGGRRVPWKTNDDLPAGVRSSLPAEAQGVFREVANRVVEGGGSDVSAIRQAWTAVKNGWEKDDAGEWKRKKSGKSADALAKGTAMGDISFFMPITKKEPQKDGSVIVTGYASTPTKDLDDEIISLDAVKKALPAYMEWRNVRAMHQPNAVGTAKEAHVDDVGLYLRARIVEPGAVNLVNEGVYQGFSIGGRKLAKTGDTVTDLELVEISIVDRPCNPDTRFAIAKGAKVINPQRIDLVRAIESIGRDHDQIVLDRAEVGMIGSLLAKLGLGKTADVILPAAGRRPMPSAAGQAGEGADASKRDVSDAERAALADQGHAMPDGSFPIKGRGDLENAVQAFGRAKNKASVKRHIVRRAKDLGATDALPDDWSGSTGGDAAKAAGATDLVKSANLYTVSSMISLLGQLEYLEECCEDGGSMCCGVPSGGGDVIECSKEFTDKFGSLLVQFADMTAELLDLAISNMKEEEAEEARGAAGEAAKAARAIGYSHTTKFADSDDDVVSRLATIAKAAGADRCPAESSGDTLANLKNLYRLSA